MPMGSAFPLGMYSWSGEAQMRAEAVHGWRIGHSYNSGSAALPGALAAGLQCLVRLPGGVGMTEAVTEAGAQAVIDPVGSDPALAWWDFPEELRYWRPLEMQAVRDLSVWTRRLDPLQRPNYMYIPGHYSQQDVQEYVPWLDVIPASVYTTYMEQPQAWARWRMESVVAAILAEGKTIGRNHLAGEKWPVAVLELFHKAGTPLMTPQGSYHDFYQCLVSGARGIMVYSFFHRSDDPALAACYDRLCVAAREISGDSGLGSAVTLGNRMPQITTSVVTGPQRTPTFTVWGDPALVDYPSLDAAAWDWQGKRYVIAVNSGTGAISGRISGLGVGTTAEVLFEGRSVALADGVLVDAFPSLGVHIYRISPDNSLLVAATGSMGVNYGCSGNLSVSSLLAQTSNVEGRPVSLVSVQAAPTARGGTVTIASGLITYQPQVGFAGTDSFTYTITDGIQTVSGTVNVFSTTASGKTSNIYSHVNEGGGKRMLGFGVPGRTYQLQFSLNLTAWAPVSAAIECPSNGTLTLLDPGPLPPTRMYRLMETTP